MSQGHTSQRLRPFKPLRFGRYTLFMPLSTGGMGEIFLARLEGSDGLDTLCVIKKILPHLAQDPHFVERFIDEARILVKLSHGNVAQVLDMGVHDGAPYIALEFIDGKDLRRVLQRTRDRKLPLPLSFVLSVMSRVLDALAHAHRQRDEHGQELNLVHRDVSPQNVLISYEGEVKVIDFGLAKSAQSASRTNPSVVLGKFMYMSPEQARHKPVDRRSDLYAVGLCLWELVAGRNPFDEVPPGEIMAKVANPAIPPLQSVEPLCPAALSRAVERALSPDPAQRFQTAEEFRGVLQGLLQQIDPLAGAETTSRFMRDAFAAEYQAERRVLASVNEQARALTEAEFAAPADASEETLDNAPSPFATGRPTPMATPAVTLPAEPTPLSFQATRKTTSGARRAHGDHEKETLPSIQLKTELSVPVAPPVSAPPAPAPAAAPGKIRAKVLVKSFDQESTEAATPAIAEPEPLPSIVVDGLPEDAAPTEQEMPALEAPPSPPPPRAARAGAPKKAKGKPPGEKRPRRDGVEKTGEKPLVRASKPPAPLPVRTDTQLLQPVAERVASTAPAPAAPRNERWLWFAVPLIAVLGLGALIAWDLHNERQRAEQAEAEAPPPEPAPEPRKAAPPQRPRLALPEPPPVPVPEPEPAPAPEPPPRPDTAPRKKPGSAPAPKAAAPAGSPGAAALAALKADFDQLTDEGVQRRFVLKLKAFESDVDAKGEDAAWVQRVQAVHAEVKTELAKQQ
jgi:serine/threonine protein kinase